MKNEFNFNKADEQTANLIIQKCDQNYWLMNAEYPLSEYEFSFAKVDNLDDLEKIFNYGNWSIRNGFIYEDLAFVQQMNGGDEWLTLKFDKEKNEWIPFESLTVQPSIDRGDFKNLMNDMVEATPAECVNLEYRKSAVEPICEPKIG